MEKITKLTQHLKENEALIVSDKITRQYLTGFPSSAGTLLLTKNVTYFLIDFRYFEKAARVVTNAKVILCTGLYVQLYELLKKENVKTIFVETDRITLENFERLKTKLCDFEISTDSFFSKKIKELRSIKTAREIDFITKAQNITDKAFLNILNDIKIGVTEREIALNLEFYMKKLGSDGIAFDVIAVSGKNSSLPHGVPTDKKIENGDFITMDFGAAVSGYCSDMTRTVAVGQITDEQKMVYNTVLKAQALALEEIKSGATCKDVDKVARDFIDNAGFKGCFGHGLGHSVGLEIHENPACNTSDQTPLESGMIMTVEPGIYLENRFGVRIEDMVLVTDNGYFNFTKSQKELIIL